MILTYESVTLPDPLPEPVLTDADDIVIPSIGDGISFYFPLDSTYYTCIVYFIPADGKYQIVYYDGNA